MQLDDNNIHKLFAIKTLRHTNTSSKLHIVIMKTTHNINHVIYAMHAVLLLGYCMLYALCYMLYALCLTSKYCLTVLCR
jgi:hypothetical protein